MQVWAGACKLTYDVRACESLYVSASMCRAHLNLASPAHVQASQRAFACCRVLTTHLPDSRVLLGGLQSHSSRSRSDRGSSGGVQAAPGCTLSAVPPGQVSRIHLGAQARCGNGAWRCSVTGLRWRSVRSAGARRLLRQATCKQAPPHTLCCSVVGM